LSGSTGVRSPAEGTEAPGTEPPSSPPRGRLWLQKLALAAASTVVCLLLIEGGFRLAGYEPIYSVYSKPEFFWQRDKVLGWVQQPGARGTYVGPRPFPVEFREPVRFNSLGLRGGEITALPPGGRRILLLGDSQAAGFEVAEDQTYAVLVGQQLTADLGVPVQVVNAGVRGYGTDQSLLWYLERGRRLHPDVVVFHASENDPEDDTTLHRMRRPFGKAAFAQRGDGSLALVGSPIPSYPMCSAYRLDPEFRVVRIDGPKARAFCWLQTRLADHSAFLTFVSTRIERNPRLLEALYGLGTPDEQARPLQGPEPGGSHAAAPAAPATPATPATPAAPAIPAVPAAPAATVAPPAPAPAVDYARRLTTALILRMAEAARQDGARFVLLANDAYVHTLDTAALDGAGIETVHVNEALGDDQRELRFPNDGHLNRAGHRRLAAFLAPRLAADLRR
jgi:lysophospholipase L1-like esterase